MRRQLLPALGMVLVFTVLTGLLYPLVVTGIAQTAFQDKANGSLLTHNGEVVGSRWLGQPFRGPGYFHPRPALGGPSNYGPTNPLLIGNVPGVNLDEAVNSYATPEDPYCVPDDVSGCNPDTLPQRVLAYRAENGLPPDAPVPVDAVTASGSGLDPHISVANARLQAPRVAAARRMSPDEVGRLIDEYTDKRGLGFLGEPGVNVLQLNLALDRA